MPTFREVTDAAVLAAKTFPGDLVKAFPATASTWAKDLVVTMVEKKEGPLEAERDIEMHQFAQGLNVAYHGLKQIGLNDQLKRLESEHLNARTALDQKYQNEFQEVDAQYSTKMNGMTKERQQELGVEREAMKSAIQSRYVSDLAALEGRYEQEKQHINEMVEHETPEAIQQIKQKQEEQSQSRDEHSLEHGR